jgi:LysM domain
MTVTRLATTGADTTASKPQRQRGSDVRRPVAAIAVLAGALVGLPLLLLWAGGSPLPTGVLSLTGIGERLLQQDSGQLPLDVLLGVAWLGWASFAFSVATEVAALLRHRATPRLVGLGSAQLLAGRLVTAAVLVLPTHSVALAVTAPPVTIVSSSQALAPVPAAADVSPPAAATARHIPSKTYVVQPPRHGHRDSLWSIAEHHLGDPLRWREIADLNRGRSQPDGRRLEDPHWIYPGWHLRMPADATGLRALEPPTPTPAAPPRTGEPTQHVQIPPTSTPRSTPTLTPDDESSQASPPPGTSPTTATPGPTSTSVPEPSVSRDNANHDVARTDDGVPLGALAGGGRPARRRLPGGPRAAATQAATASAHRRPAAASQPRTGRSRGPAAGPRRTRRRGVPRPRAALPDVSAVPPGRGRACQLPAGDTRGTADPGCPHAVPARSRPEPAAALQRIRRRPHLDSGAARLK